MVKNTTEIAISKAGTFCIENLPDFRRFIALNTPHWQPLPASKQKLLVSVYPSPPALVSAGLMIQAICARNELEPIVTLDGSAAEQEVARALFSSFGVREFVFVKKSQKLGWWRQRSLRLRLLKLKLLSRFNFEKSLDQVVASFRVCGVEIGDLVYDFFIRFKQNYQRWPENRSDWFRHFKEHLIYFHRHLAFYRSQDFRGVLVCDPVYCFPEAFFLRMAKENQAKIWVTTGRFCREYQEPDDFEFDRYRFSKRTIDRSPFPKTWEQEIEHYLAARFSGDIEHHDVAKAFGSKTTYTRETFLESVGLPRNDQRALIFLMPHCFSDANHKCQGHLYRDFFTWYRATLTELPKHSEAIWIVRPHPSRSHYGEEGMAEKYFHEFESDHVRLAPDNLSTNTVLDLARAVITVNGTIGLEAACRGVPVVICANAIYSGLGFTLQPKSREEYHGLLGSLHQADRLSLEQIKAARQALYFYHILSRPKSKVVTQRVLRPGSPSKEMIEVFNLAYREMADGLEIQGWGRDALRMAIQQMFDQNRPVATQVID